MKFGGGFLLRRHNKFFAGSREFVSCGTKLLFLAFMISKSN